MTPERRKADKQEPRLSLWTRVKYMAVRGAVVAIYKLGGLDGMYRFGWAFGAVESLLQYNRRRRIYRRMDDIFDPPLAKSEKRRIARGFFCRVRCDKMIYTIMDRIDRAELLGRVDSEGKEHLDRAIGRGGGTFLMFSHQGSHHLGGILLVLHGYPISGLRDPNESPLRQYIQERFEESFPEFRDLLEIIPTDVSPRPFFKAFKANRTVAAAMDVWRDRGNARTMTVEVFGQEREFVSGMTEIALRCKAAIVVGFILSLPGYRYRMIFHPWLTDPEGADDSVENVRSVMQQYARLIEEHTRKYPSHISKTK